MASKPLIYSGICIAIVVICLIFTITLLLLIIDMKVWNGHIMMIFAMTVFQLVYDVTLYPNTVCPNDTAASEYTNYPQFLGGISSSIVSNEIGFCILYILLFKKTVNIVALFPHFMVLAIIPAIPSIILYAIYQSDMSANLRYEYYSIAVYAIIRSVTIVINFVCFFYSEKLAHNLASATTLNNSTKSSNSTTKSTLSILNPVRSMKYYPLVQAISRLGYFWYELQFGFDLTIYNSSSNMQFVVAVIALLVLPAAPIGYFVIYIRTQPNAWKHLLRRLGISQAAKNARKNHCLDCDMISSTPDSWNMSIHMQSLPPPQNSVISDSQLTDIESRQYGSEIGTSSNPIRSDSLS